MLTRCPSCQTTFRVTSEQLTARQGRVRCGACREVFNALASLADEMHAVAAPAAETTEVPEPATVSEPESLPAAEMPEPPATEVAEVFETAAEAGDAESRRSQDGEMVAAAAPEEGMEAEELPAAWTEAGEAPLPRRWPWLLGSLLLLIAAAGQLVYIFRVELAVLMPGLRPALVAGCEVAGCTVPRPHKPELVSIESSDLAPAGDGRLRLTATLRNRAPFAQDYPNLELTLTDTQDAALLRKVLEPAEWLPVGRGAQEGFAARGDVAVKLTLEAPGVPAVGYRLYLFYP